MEADREIFATGFGTITDRRVRYHVKKLFGLGGSKEDDIPLRQITTVGLGTSRHPIWGILLILVALGLFSAGGGAIIAGVIFLGLAGLFLWGFPQVILNTAGHDHRFTTGLPWTRGEAAEFVSALRAQLFKDAAEAPPARWG